MFNIIGGLPEGFEERVIVDGATITGTHPAIGMVSREASRLPWRTVLENLAHALEIAGMDKTERLSGDGNSN